MNRIEELLLRVLRHWLTYYVIAWLAAVVASAVALYYAWTAFDNKDRPDGNAGHATIDFGGQYLMGRMLVTGNGRELYNRAAHRRVLREVYPEEESTPNERSDAENLMYWMMGGDDPEQAKAAGSFLLPLGAADPLSASVLATACREDVWTDERVEKAEQRRVGGPLYPPVNAFVNAPLALMTPHTAYRVQQCLNLALVFVAAAGARSLARGRAWVPLLALAVLLFPGYSGSINLGQNATLTLTILVWGWALAARGRPVAGGVVWGLLVFKPVWALAFFLVPFLSRRWRFCAAMVATGAGLALLTLPFVRVQSWLDWLAIGKEAAVLYDMERNWIFLSRDLLSVPRRWMLDFDRPLNERLEGPLWMWHLWGDTFVVIPIWLAALLSGWAMLLFALENTVRLAVLRRKYIAAPDGPPAAFLFLGAWMCCFHFMYYDALLGAAGLFLLFTEPRRYLAPLLVVFAPLRDDDAGRAVVAYHRPALPEALPPPVPLCVTPRGVWVLNRMAPTAFVLLLLIHYLFPVLGWGSHWGTPWDTFALAGVWAWCGWQWLRRGEKVAAGWGDAEPAGLGADVLLVTTPGKNGEAAAPEGESAGSRLSARGAGGGM
jgi:hypothetical protein